MKFLRIIILVALVASFIPLDAFCDDQHETTEHHHGIVLCHGFCTGVGVTSEIIFYFPPNNSEILSHLYNGFIYEAPVLPQELRPPIIQS